MANVETRLISMARLCLRKESEPCKYMFIKVLLLFLFQKQLDNLIYAEIIIIIQ